MHHGSSFMHWQSQNCNDLNKQNCCPFYKASHSQSNSNPFISCPHMIAVVNRYNSFRL